MGSTERNPGSEDAAGRHEVCVFGAGPAGVAVAMRLLEKGRDVLILERPPKLRPWGGESFTGAIRAPLTTLGFWDLFSRAGHVAGHERQSSWGGEPRAESTIFQPYGAQWHVDRDRFDDDLRTAVRQRADIFYSYRRLDSVANDAGTWRIKFDGRAECNAKYLVDATGRTRVLARRLGAIVARHDRLIGLTAAVSSNESDAGIRSMLLEATPFGWWYAAPTPKGHVVALFTDPDLAPQEVRRRLRPVAANSAFTHVHAGQGWMPVGDACASHDPLCGWGVHRALDNGIRLADAIDAFLASGKSSPIDEYHRHCQRQYQAYLKGLSDRYAMERRWPMAPFWQRRHRPASA
jgi:flavin-dependent dehydrogenase